MFSLEKRKADRIRRNKENGTETSPGPVTTNEIAGNGDGGADDSGGNANNGGAVEIDNMTVAQLDEYIKARNAAPVGDKAAKVTLAKSLPVEVQAAGWGG